jgi:hypothetical protein
MAATASSANQLASKSTIAPGINFVFMAISRKSNPCSGPRFHVYLPIDVYLPVDVVCVAKTGKGVSVAAITFWTASRKRDCA